MTFPQKKLYLALLILISGMAVAVFWFTWQGIVLNRNYPYNNFLFAPNSSLSDFTDFLRPHAPAGNYFPSAFLVFYPFRGLPPTCAALLFQGIFILGLLLILHANLLRLKLELKVLLLADLTFIASYPVLICVDRGNIEILIAFCIATFLWLCSKERFGYALAILLPAICFKFYPGILLLLFCQRNRIHWAIVGALAFFFINGGCAWLLPQHATGVSQQGLRLYTERYVLGDWGTSGTASAWNMFRLVVWLIRGCWEQTFTWPMPWSMVVVTLDVYYALAFAGFLLVLRHILYVEKNFFRKAILLLLYLTVSVPGGGDYKLLHIVIALVVMILLTGQRPGDLLIVCLLAFSLIPKQELILPFIDDISASCPDVSIGVILNPMCLLTAMWVIAWGGWQQQN